MLLEPSLTFYRVGSRNIFRHQKSISGIPFALKNARIEWVDCREGLGVEPQEESSLSRFNNDALREKMRAKNEYFGRERYIS